MRRHKLRQALLIVPKSALPTVKVEATPNVEIRPKRLVTYEEACAILAAEGECVNVAHLEGLDTLPAGPTQYTTRPCEQCGGNLVVVLP